MLYDIAIPINADLPVYPGDPPLELRRLMEVVAGEPYTLSALSLGVHLGTHVDAPAHYFADGATIEAVGLDALVGPARVLDLTGLPLPGPAIGVDDLLAAGLAADTERLLLKTRNSELWRAYPGRFAPAWLGLSAEAAAWLTGRGVRLVGIDYMSIEPPDSADFATHRTLLGAGTLILEGLDLSAVPAGHYHLTALPLRLDGAEAAPTRAILTPIAPPAAR